MTVCLSSLCALAYACAVSKETSIDEQAIENLNGSNLNGSNLNGSNLNGYRMLAFMVSGATKWGDDLTNLHVDKGELVAEQYSTTLRGSDLKYADLVGLVGNPTGTPTTMNTPFLISDVTLEQGHDPTNTGSTYLYEIKYWNSETSHWDQACPPDTDGVSAAIPLAAEWDQTGNRSDSSSMFTLACTSGAIGKCYRWGYRPWVTGYGDLATMHWTCTRLARADYCGDGTSHTYDGHLIDIWDLLPSPGPIQAHGTTGTFDAGWNTSGAACMSDASRAAYGAAIAAECPMKLPAPGAGGTACNSQQAALSQDSSLMMFREVYSY